MLEYKKKKTNVKHIFGVFQVALVSTRWTAETSTKELWYFELFGFDTIYWWVLHSDHYRYFNNNNNEQLKQKFEGKIQQFQLFRLKRILLKLITHQNCTDSFNLVNLNVGFG